MLSLSPAQNPPVSFHLIQFKLKALLMAYKFPISTFHLPYSDPVSAGAHVVLALGFCLKNSLPGLPASPFLSFGFSCY